MCAIMFFVLIYKEIVMKKKILTFLVAVCLIIPCIFMLAACGDNPSDPTDPTTPSGPPPQNPQDQTYIINNDATLGIFITEEHSGEPFDAVTLLESGKTYAIWLSDIYDKDTLQLYFDATPLTLNLLSDPDYDERIIAENPRKIATVTLPTVTEGIHEITNTVEEEELRVTFTGSLDNYSPTEVAVLNDWHLPLADGKSFSELIGTDFTITTTYSELRHTGIPYTCDQRFGYYSQYAIFQSIESGYSANVRYMGGNDKNEYIFNIDPFDGFVSKDIELTFNAEALSKNHLSVSGLNDNSFIMHYVDGEDGYYRTYSWPIDNENDIKIYLEPYAGVNLDNVEVYIYDTKMNLQNDAGQRFFTIPKNTLPIDYYDGTVDNLLLENTFGDKFLVTIKNVVVDQSADLFTEFTVTSTNPNVNIDADANEYFTSEEGVTYYIPHDTAVLNLSFSTIFENLDIDFNGNTISLDDYLEPDLTLSEDDTQDSYRSGENNFYYSNINSTIDFLHVHFDDSGVLDYIHIEFNISSNTAVEIIF